MSRPRVLIEDWLPIAEIGVECRRERGAVSVLPPTYFLHIWWARRPLMASRAAILGSTLPSWSGDWPVELQNQFPDKDAYHSWVLRLLGVWGDPVAGRARVLLATEQGIRLGSSAYDGPRAFSISPTPEDLEVVESLHELTWGTPNPSVCDPMAGGGSIPFEALRFGFKTYANELNPVAAMILKGTLDWPSRLGEGFGDVVGHWGARWSQAVREQLQDFFPDHPDGPALVRIFARTVPCPETGKSVPLSPNWWIRRGSDPVAVRVTPKSEMSACEVTLARGKEIDFDPDVGSVRRGEGRSPWTGGPISSEYIKAEAQAGRMGYQLLAVEVVTDRGREFREPWPEEEEALVKADDLLRARWADWSDEGLIPLEPFPVVGNDLRPLQYGMSRWCDFFAPRQLLSLLTCVEQLRQLESDAVNELSPAEAQALITYLAFVVDKAAAYDCLTSRWHVGRQVVSPQFERHDFSFKWSFAETNLTAQGRGFDWAVGQIVKAYRQLAGLLAPTASLLGHTASPTEVIDLAQGDASGLPYDSGSLHAVVVDPPYYDNVQYAELSDFFYVWQKRTLGHLYPQFFTTELTDKTSEAVANPARFEALDKKRAKDLAKADYERKMTRVFAEANRVLRDDGVLTVMFTHKRVEAWDTLGQSLIEAGFEIESSWPVHTESEHSLHQARKAAAASTILMTCRKRTDEREPAWWDDLQGEVRRVAREKAEEFLAAGIDGVDLYISTFGPTLSVISRQWPVYTSDVDQATGDPRPLRPEEALDLAREEVADLRRLGLLLGRDVEFDPVTDWYLLAWDAFGAVEIPYDEARKLALALGLDLDGELVRLRVVSKKASSVILQEPKQRRRPGLADPEDTSFVRLLDAAHALMVAYREDGVRGAEAFLKRTRFASEARFQALLQALVNAIPRTKLKGKFVRPEAADLDGLAVLFSDLRFPAEPEIVLEPAQAAFDLGGGGLDDDEDSDDHVDKDE